MDDTDAGEKREETLECRPPTQSDLVGLCRELNRQGARYVVIGGFAIIAAGFPRTTGAIDLIVANDPENERKVFAALSTLPDNAAGQLQPGELKMHKVVRVADEILVDLTIAPAGIEYAEAVRDVILRDVDGVPIPFASPRLLWRLKSITHRAKDEMDIVYLRQWFVENGGQPPER